MAESLKSVFLANPCSSDYWQRPRCPFAGLMTPFGRRQLASAPSREPA